MNIAQLKKALNFMGGNDIWRFKSHSDDKDFYSRHLELINDAQDVVLCFKVNHEYNLVNLNRLSDEPINEEQGISYTPKQLILQFVDEPNQVDWFNDDETIKTREFMEANIINKVTAFPEFMYYVNENNCDVNHLGQLVHLHSGHLVTNYQIKRIYDSLRIAKPINKTVMM